MASEAEMIERWANVLERALEAACTVLAILNTSAVDVQTLVDGFIEIAEREGCDCGDQDQVRHRADRVCQD